MDEENQDINFDWIESVDALEIEVLVKSFLSKDFQTYF